MLMNISKTKTTSDNQQNMLLLYQTEIHLNFNSNELHWEGFNCKIECKIENSQFKVAVQSREKKNGLLMQIEYKNSFRIKVWNPHDQ